jgi:hypothetical protein
MAHKSDAEIVASTHNTARFFTENRQIAWVALLLVVGWGMFAYEKMPKRKDPDIPVREAQAIRSGLANLNSAISGNSGQAAGPRVA